MFLCIRRHSIEVGAIFSTATCRRLHHEAEPGGSQAWLHGVCPLTYHGLSPVGVLFTSCGRTITLLIPTGLQSPWFQRLWLQCLVISPEVKVLAPTQNLNIYSLTPSKLNILKFQLAVTDPFLNFFLLKISSL